MNVFKKDKILQEIFDIACYEGHEDELRDVSDLYSLGFDSAKEALEFGFNLGEFVGKFHFGDTVYEFLVPESNTLMYFIGSFNEVKMKIYKAL